MEAELIKLIKKLSWSLKPNVSLTICKEIADLAGLAHPENEEDCYEILQWVNDNYPNAYKDATKSAREFWNLI
jgi:hypothetical protein